MNLIRYSILIGFYFLTCEVKSQSDKSILLYGKISNAGSYAPLPWAHVYIDRYLIGTSTNNEGLFELKLPDSLANYPITVSAVGYNTRSFKASELVSPVKIFLTEGTYLLDPLEITVKYDSAEAIMKRALDHLAKNYPTKPYYMEGFLRELSLLDSTYTRLIESAISIKRSGYSKKIYPQKNEIRIDQMRKSFDYREPDHLRLGWVAKMFPITTNTAVKLFSKFDLVDYLFKPLDQHYFSGKILFSSYHWEINKVTQTETDTLVVLDFKSKYDVVFLPQGQLYINQSDHGIVKIIIETVGNTNVKYPPTKFLYKGKLLDSVCVEYKKNGDLYYPKWISAFYPATDAMFTSNEENEQRIVKGQQYTFSTFMTNAVYTRKEYEGKIKKKETEKFDAILYDKEMEYDSVFWANYNMVLVDELVEKARRDMEKELELDQQFKIEKEKR